MGTHVENGEKRLGERGILMPRASSSFPYSPLQKWGLGSWTLSHPHPCPSETPFTPPGSQECRGTMPPLDRALTPQPWDRAGVRPCC